MAFPRLHCVSGAVDVADILTTVAAANTLVKADKSKRYKIVDVELRAIGGDAAASTTIQVTNGVEVAWAATTTNVDEDVIMRADTTNVNATHLGHWGEGDTPIALIRTGIETATATSIDYVVHYLVEDCN